MDVNRDSKGFKCEKCDYATDIKSYLTKHLLRGHSNYVVKHVKVSVNCSDCNKTFSSTDNLKRHKNAIHLKLKPFKCNTCSFATAKKDRIVNHNKVHNIENVPEDKVGVMDDFIEKLTLHCFAGQPRL